MNKASKISSPSSPGSSQRLVSLDAFRGFTILSMIFVNYLPGMPGVPDWLLHAPANLDAYTVPDLVFPAFLFIVGVALPLAFDTRLKRGESVQSLVRHILSRGAALIFLGVIMVNESAVSSEHTLISGRVWYFLAYLCVVIIWMRAPRAITPERGRWLRWGKWGASIVLLVLLALFRRDGANGSVTWFATEWWGILGIIGWSYLVAALFYLLFRRQRTALLGVLGLMMAVTIADQESLFSFLGSFNRYWSIGGLLGTHPGIVMSGIIVGVTLLRSRGSLSHAENLRFMVAFGAGLVLAGQLIRPVHGISKIGATESFALVTAGISCLLFAVFFSLIEVSGSRRWAALLIPAGANPLLAYLLPSFLGSTMAFTGSWRFFWPLWETGGLAGLANAAVITVLVLGLTALCNRWKIVLHL